jgi:Rod binding domain-containing protein
MDTTLAIAAPQLTRAPPRTQTAVQTQADAVRVGREFEQMFLSQMLAQMFAGIKSDGVFGGGFGEEMYRSLQVDEYARALTQRGGVGIAESVTRELLRLQEASRG